jgi:hypothetical protein
VRDYRTWLKTVAKAKAKATTINNTLAAVDDFYTRRGLGPAKAAREDVRRTAPRETRCPHGAPTRPEPPLTCRVSAGQRR